MAFKWFRKHNKQGAEIPDPTPIEVPMRPPLTIQQQLARFEANQALMAHLSSQGLDTMEQAEDFGPDEPEDPHFRRTPYEMADDDLPVQTRLDEQRGGMVADIPQDRLERAQERLREARKPKAKVEGQEPPKGDSGAK